MNAQRRLLEDVTLAIMQREHYRSLQNKESLTAAEITGLDEDAIRRYQYDPMFHATVDSYAHSVWEVVKNLSTKLYQVRSLAKAYLDHSDSGTYRDSAGLRPGMSPQAEDLRGVLSDD